MRTCTRCYHVYSWMIAPCPNCRNPEFSLPHNLVRGIDGKATEAWYDEKRLLRQPEIEEFNATFTVGRVVLCGDKPRKVVIASPATFFPGTPSPVVRVIDVKGGFGCMTSIQSVKA